jgi:hypothetical protein
MQHACVCSRPGRDHRGEVGAGASCVIGSVVHALSTTTTDLARRIPTIDLQWGYTNVDLRWRRNYLSYVGQYFSLLDLTSKKLIAVLRRTHYLFGSIKVIYNNYF